MFSTFKGIILLDDGFQLKKLPATKVKGKSGTVEIFALDSTISVK